MATNKKSILNRLYIVFVFSTLFFITIVAKLFHIQYSEDGDRYRNISVERTIKNDTIHANRGNVYADDGSLLATSISRYEIRMDAYTVEKDDFEENIKGNHAALVIGDRAFALNTKHAYIYDLSAIWKEMTGLPFVFAAWVANKKLPQDFIISFNKALEKD